MISEETFNWYLEATSKTAKYPGAFSGDSPEMMYLICGLVDEFGEYIEKTEVSPVSDKELKLELGDVLWYLYRLFAALKVPYTVPFPDPSCSDIIKAFAKNTGRIAGRIKKSYRDGINLHDSGKNRTIIMTALFRCQDLIATILYIRQYDMTEVLNMNIDKLADRANRGVLGGSGDHR